ncbi:non-ribosomal peptide synthetase [Histomonas meleagridis]|uniref:non-ribosomal peptide synthetase n=1 Tax=Histomonas meleagridis TaxID=135588 RepID=UPI0035599D7F|nr:non-ribosomal peptide synthetase [Histomonas meleagridis]KAH0806039.1 non-ribosomal peptide synthetase [Histomonas meleagridis]
MSKDFGILVSTLDLNKIQKPELPKPADDGRIPTLNGKGYATHELEPISEQFTEYASTIKIPVIDGGAAFGATTIAALKKGAIVIANEIDQHHLDYIAKNSTLTDDDRTRLYLKLGSITEIDFPEQSIGAIHMARVMHFFHPNEVEKFFEKASKWLVPNGRIYLVTMSQYHYGNTPGYYEKYNKALTEGVEWPGEIEEYKFKSDCYYLQALDPNVIHRVATKYGFTVKKLELWGGQHDDDYTCAILINKYSH